MRVKALAMIPVAAVLGFIAVQSGRYWMDRQVNDRMRAADALARPAAAAPSFATLVVAAAPLRFGVELTPAMLREIPWAQGQTPKGAYAKIADVFAEKTKRVVIAAMDDNEPLLATKITGPGQRAVLAAILDAGMKAVTVRVDDVVGVAGFVQPGDRVDVLLTRQREKGDAYADVLLQNIKVLGIDQLVDDHASKPSVSRSVTLEASIAQAQRLIVAQSVGSLTLALRPAGVTTTEEPRRVTSADLLSTEPARTATADEDAPVASFGQGRRTVSVIRNMTRQEYSVPGRAN